MRYRLALVRVPFWLYKVNGLSCMIKGVTFLLCLIPSIYVSVQVYWLQAGMSHKLGADPGKELVLILGETTIRLLLLTLLITPLRRISGWKKLLTVRRMLGLFTFYYASLHMTGYLVLLLELNFGNLIADISKRPYITVGFCAYLLLIPLAITSTNRMMRLLRHRWVPLHRLVYVVAMLAVVHVIWLSKSSFLDAFVYGSAAATLLIYRVMSHRPGLFQWATKTSS